MTGLDGRIHPMYEIRHCSTRDEAAEAYAAALVDLGTDWDGWADVNREVLRHWPKGLQYIKTKAWKLAAA